MRRLAGSFDRDLPGLPRGRGRLAVDEVQDAQRDRILRAVISSTAEKGIASTTIADVVGRARVSRQAFYKQFESKEACLIAAIDAGIEVIVSNITSTQSSTANLSLHEQLSAVIEKYLETCSSEPEFVRAWVVDLPVAGPAGVAKRNEYVELLADALLVGYSSKSSEAPGREVFLAAIGTAPLPGLDGIKPLATELRTRHGASGFTSVSTTGSDCRRKLLTRFEPFQHQAPTRQVTYRHGSAATGVAATSHEHSERSKGHQPPLTYFASGDRPCRFQYQPSLMPTNTYWRFATTAT